ncbi:MAG: NAD(P)H-binding protein [Bacteroidia bacterium]
MNSQPKTALISGSTGLTGGYLLNLLLESPSYNKVISLVRKPTGKQNDKLEEKVINFENLESEISAISAEDVFICLGTTIKKAKTQENFKKVDLEYPIKIAKTLNQNGAKQLAVVSAMGANSKSKIFYNRTKGQMEDALEKVGYENLFILQPSLLMGNRNEFRLGEKISQKVMCIVDPLMVGPAKKYRSINAYDVAFAMLALCNGSLSGLNRIESEDIKEIARLRK